MEEILSYDANDLKMRLNRDEKLKNYDQDYWACVESRKI